MGTYYPKRAHDPAPDARQLQRLVYHIKRRWSVGPILVTYPGHDPTWVRTQLQACELAAQIYASAWPQICEVLDLPSNGKVELVPIPSSGVTRATAETARWGAAQLAAAMQRRSLGEVKQHVYNVEAQKADHEGSSDERKTAPELFDNYDVRGKPQRPVLYVDDIFTRGRHLAAIDQRLGRPARAAVLVVGFTDDDYRESCLEWRAKDVEYADVHSRIAVTEVERQPLSSPQ